MHPLKILIKKKAGFEDIPLPEYSSEGASGMDLRAAIDKPMEILPGETLLIPTGLFMAIPLGFEGQIRPRSGLALKYNIFILNTPGTIDSDFRGEVSIILTNFGKNPFHIMRGDRTK